MASWSPSPSCKQRTARRGVARTTCPRAGGASRVLRSELSSDEAGRRMCPETCPQLGRYDPVQRPPTPHFLALGSQERPANTDLLIRGSQVRSWRGHRCAARSTDCRTVDRCRRRSARSGPSAVGRLRGISRDENGAGLAATEAAEEYLRYLGDDRQRKPSTVRDARSVIRNHLLPPFGERRLEDITEQEVERWARRLGADAHCPTRRSARSSSSSTA
jgi:hypothetical protein